MTGYWSRPRMTGIALAGVVLVVFAAANAHLVYMAFASSPDCVAHLKSRFETSPDSGAYIAASPSC